MVSLESFHPDLIDTKNKLYDTCGYKTSVFIKETESQEYGACTFSLNETSIKFRVAKITPSKIGQFVTLWKRDGAGITQPHEDTDKIDFYIISVRNKTQFGQFVFPKSVLIKQSILSTQNKEGKRGFRVYPPWDKTDNRQAQKTQQWQLEFFLEITNESLLEKGRMQQLYSLK